MEKHKKELGENVRLGIILEVFLVSFYVFQYQFFAHETNHQYPWLICKLYI